MQNFMKTIISAVQTWTKGKIKDSTADWNQNDSGADNYVKNRTHYDTRRTEEIIYTFDGNLENRESIQMDSLTYFVKLSDDILTADKLVGAVLSLYNVGETFTAEITGDMIVDQGDFVGVGNGEIISVINETESLPLSQGLWFLCGLDDTGASVYYTSSLVRYEDVGELKKLDEKYLPNEYATVDEVQTVQTTADTAQTTADNALANAATAQTTADGKMSATDPVGSGSFSMGRMANTTVGTNSHAEGYNVTASGRYSHAEGSGTSATGETAHAEGYNTTAKQYAHAEGQVTDATGQASHAEGYRTTASGAYSHAEGYGTTASGKYSHAEGKYNLADTNERYVHITGNGTFDTSRSNAHTLDWSGNAWYQGDVYVGGTSQDDAEKLAKVSEIPTNTSDLTNDSNFITNTASDLTNYYLKSETYTQEEVDELVSAIPKFSIEVVETLPTADISTTTVYLLKSGDETDNLYTEYIYVNDTWEYLGKQTVDLTGYALKSEIPTVPTNVSEFANDAGYLTDVSDKMDKVTDGTSGNFIALDDNGNAVDSGKNSSSFVPISALNDAIAPHLSNTDIHITADERTAWNAKAEASDIPTKVSELTNDSGYVTSVPVTSVNGKTGDITLAASEVGADASGTASAAVATHNTATDAHADIRAEIAEVSSRIVSEVMTMTQEQYNSMTQSTLSILYSHGVRIIAVEVPSSDGSGTTAYINQVLISIDTDGNIYNDVGYKNNYRLNSTGGETAQSYNVVTGYIPASAGDIIRIDINSVETDSEGNTLEWYNTEKGNYICAYDSNFNYICSCTSQGGGLAYGTQLWESMSLIDGISVITLANISNIAYIRVSGEPITQFYGADGSLLIVTVNQEI